MKLETILIGFICIIICSLPFVLTTRNRKKKEQQLLHSLKNLAAEYHCQILQYEICGTYIIGLDDTKRLLFFIAKTKDTIHKQWIDLSSMKNCFIVKSHSPNQKDTGTLEKISLQFIPKDHLKGEYILNFYHKEDRFLLDGELQSIEKWHSLVQPFLNSGSTI